MAQEQLAALLYNLGNSKNNNENAGMWCKHPGVFYEKERVNPKYINRP